MSKEAISEIVKRNKKELHGNEEPGTYDSAVVRSAAAAPGEPQSVQALTILIDFPDAEKTIDKSKIDNFLNLSGYTGYDNNGSVKDYFLDVSGGQVTLTADVQGYFRAPRDKTYYNGGLFPQWRLRVQALIRDALD